MARPLKTLHIALAEVDAQIEGFNTRGEVVPQRLREARVEVVEQIDAQDPRDLSCDSCGSSNVLTPSEYFGGQHDCPRCAS